MTCWLCRRDLDDDYRVVTLPNGQVGRICWRCIEQGDVEETMSYEERDEHEGDPAWNGAFG